MKRFALIATALLISACTTTTLPAVTEFGPTALPSQSSFTTTESQLRAALTSRDLELFEVVNHGEGARSVGMNIGQSKLFIFGNPKSGTQLMMENRLAAFELPMKVLLYEGEAGEVWVASTSIETVARDYNISGKDDLINTINGTLDAIRAEAAR